ncbi:MAG: hypothetical protein KatS3mg087_1206 [Patescibacteria group bacterium]|nr:MAG: hypothetical protein KatS3mg087_1206 [Patescibacteria group bacterium]
MAKCADCKYFFSNSGKVFNLSIALGEAGFCKRYPPVVVPSNASAGQVLVACFPVVGRNDWCGEFCLRDSNGLVDSGESNND